MDKLMLELYQGEVTVVGDKPANLVVEVLDFDLGLAIVDDNDDKYTIEWGDNVPFVRYTIPQ